MPTRLCWNPGMMCPPRTGRVGSWRLQEAVYVLGVPDTVPQLMGGAAMLMSVQVAEGVRYIPLAPLFAMAVSMMGRILLLLSSLWGWGIQRNQ